jgi:hypothetical protein
MVATIPNIYPIKEIAGVLLLNAHVMLTLNANICKIDFYPGVVGDIDYIAPLGMFAFRHAFHDALL